MAQSSTEPTTVSFYLRECSAIVVGALAVISFLALVSYAPNDELSIFASRGFANLIGTIGAAVAFGFFWLLGVVAFLIPVGMFGGCAAMMVWRGDEIHWLNIARRGGGALLFTVTTTLFAALHVTGYAALPAGPGGQLGVTVVSYTVAFVNKAGLTIFSLVGMLIALQLMLGFSWLDVLEVIGRGVTRVSRISLKAAIWLWRCAATTLASLEAWRARRKDDRKDAKSIGNMTPPDRLEPTFSQTASAPTVSNSESAAVVAKPPRAAEVLPRSNTEPILIDTLPSLEILTTPSQNSEFDDAEKQALIELGERLRTILADYGVSIEVESIISGPVVSRFELLLAPGIKVNKIISLSNDLAREIAVRSVRVVPVIPGKSVVGVEIPNRVRAMVTLKEVLACAEFNDAKHPLTLALGKDIAGDPVYADLERMPHLLVAGTTGSGKSVGVNTMLLSLLYRLTPDDVRLILVDPKMLELSVYEGIPHLLTPVVTDMQDAARALQWCVGEMERRYRLMKVLKVRNLRGYNEKIAEAEQVGEVLADPLWDPKTGLDQENLGKLPLIVVVIDEFADMIMIVGKKIEQLIARIAQKARAAGIHLVLATQRPSVDVITGLIKANIPCRISYQVSSQVDSRTILDQVGAEHLLGHGDMLYLPPGTSVPERVHGSFVSDEEVLAVIEDWRQRGAPQYVYDMMTEEISSDSIDMSFGDEDAEDLYAQAVSFVLESRRASASALQTKFQIGWNKAARFMDQMETQGIVSEPDRKGRREVLAAEE